MTARYAVYYAPPEDTPLWRKASAWLGCDAYTGEEPLRPNLQALDGLDLDPLIADPRGYGFHATLKAPFELVSDRDESDLLNAASEFASGLSPFNGSIAPAALGKFLAFRLQDGDAQMHALHGACVRAFEPFRKPLSDHDLERRRRARLTPEQDARLLAWGYPYIFEDFRFHMTLTGQIHDEALRSRILGALQDFFESESGRHSFDGIAIFKQPERGSRFRILQRFAFGTPISS